MIEGDSPGDDDRRQLTYAARDAYARSLGDVSPDVLAPLINPGFMSGPLWPDTRQAWKAIRNGSATIILSDGLSDPFCDAPEPNSGFGLEVLAETSDSLPEQLPASWLFDLVYQVSQQCAFHGGVRELIDRLGVVSLELPLSGPLQVMATANDTAGVLLGTMPPNCSWGFDIPGGSVRIVTAKLLWPQELEFAATGKAAREELARRFAADGTLHCSSMHRPSVV